MKILLGLSLAILAATIYSLPSAYPAAAHSVLPPSALYPALAFPGEIASPDRAVYSGRIYQGNEARWTRTGGRDLPMPGPGNPTGWPQQEEIDRDCAFQALGRVPGGLRDLSSSERQLIRELCSIRLSDSLKTLSAGFDLTGLRDNANGDGLDPELQYQLDDANRHWTNELEILDSGWMEDLDFLRQERQDLELFWEQEAALTEVSWNQDLADIVQHLNTRESDWARQLDQIDRRVAVIVGPSRERGLLLRKRSALVNQIESERLELEQELEIRKSEIDDERFLLNDEIEQSLRQLDQQIADKEMGWGEAQQELELEWSRDLERTEREWYDLAASDHRAGYFEGESEGGDPSFAFEPEPGDSDPVYSPNPANTNSETPVRTEFVPTPAPFLVSSEPDQEPAESGVRDSQGEQRQRGFFTNGTPGLPGSSLEGALALEPTTLAMLGILITLGTAALTLVRGR